MAHLGNTIINGKLEVNGEIYTQQLNGNASSATTADQAKALTSGAGSATIPVYINGSGKPVACNSTLGVSITGSAGSAKTADNANKINILKDSTKGYIPAIDSAVEPTTGYYNIRKTNIEINGSQNQIRMFGINTYMPKICLYNKHPGNDDGLGMILKDDGINFDSFSESGGDTISNLGIKLLSSTEAEARFTNFYGTFNGDLNGYAKSATQSNKLKIIKPNSNNTGYLPIINKASVFKDNSNASLSDYNKYYDIAPSNIEIDTLNNSMGVYGDNSYIRISTYKSNSSGDGSGITMTPSSLSFYSYSTEGGTTNGSIKLKGDDWNASFSSGSFGKLNVANKPVVRSADSSQTISVRILTQAEYDKISNKDANTIYFVKA